MSEENKELENGMEPEQEVVSDRADTLENTIYCPPLNCSSIIL